MGRNLEILSGDGSALWARAGRSPVMESRLKDRWCRTLGSEMVAIALWVRSMAEAANAKKLFGFWLFGSPRTELTPNGWVRDRLSEAEAAAGTATEADEADSATGSSGEQEAEEVETDVAEALLLRGMLERRREIS